jgi:hypothetical protein
MNDNDFHNKMAEFMGRTSQALDDIKEAMCRNRDEHGRLFEEIGKLKLNAAASGAKWGGITSALILGAAVLLRFL